MARPPDDPPPPTPPPAPEFDVAPPEPELDLSYDVPPPVAATDAGTRGPWYRSTGTWVAVLLLVVALVVLAVSRTSGPSSGERAVAPTVVPPRPAATPAPLTVVPLDDVVIGEQAPPPNVAAVQPAFVPAGVPVIDVPGRQAEGTVSRPDGAWLRATLAPGVYTFRVAAGADTELHLSDVFTELALDDDTDGLNPVITERLIGGDYYLWLHIHDEAVETSAPFALTIDGPE